MNSTIRFRAFLHPAFNNLSNLNEFIWNPIRGNSISINSFIGFSGLIKIYKANRKKTII